MLTVDILFSGSSGNCTLVRSEKTQILIDCGKSARAVCTALRELGTDVSNISAVFITHEHSDHISALSVICKRNALAVHMTEKSAAALPDGCLFAESIVPHPQIYSETVGDLEVSSFPLPHDSAAHVGYVIADTDGDSFGIATDMGHVTDSAVENLSRCRRVMIEANHDIEMLREGSYPQFLKRRILSPRGHLSNEDCAGLACVLADSGCEAIALAHLSPENNVPSLAYSDVRCALDSAGHQNCALIVADRDHSVRFPDAGNFVFDPEDSLYAEN